MAHNYGVCVNLHACASFLTNIEEQSTAIIYFICVHIRKNSFSLKCPLRTDFIMVASYVQLYVRKPSYWFGPDWYTIV